MNDQTPHSSRRRFLKKSAAATFGFSVMPSYLALGKPDADGNRPPSQRVNLGVIGVGGRGSVIVPALCHGGHAKAVALCDVYFKAERADQNQKRFPNAKKFADYREMFEKMEKDIDAVSVACPDHTHFPAALTAMRLKKHVYCEKPLTHTFKEAEMLMAAAKKYGVVTQMGNQGHTSGAAMQFKNLVEEGVIKDIVKIEGHKGRGGGPGQSYMDPNRRVREYPKGQPVPEGMNWDLWAGPAASKPYHPSYFVKDWRGYCIYGGAMLGDWGAHIIDFAHHYLKLGLPTKIEAVEMKDHNEVMYPLSTKLTMSFPARGEGFPACELHWSEGQGTAPKIDEKYWDEGKEARIGGADTLLHRKDGAFLVQRGSHGSASRVLPRKTMLEIGEKMKVGRVPHNHMQGFIQACMEKGKTESPFEISAPLTQVLILGNICQRMNAKMEFDPKTKRFVGNDAANAVLDGPTPRKGWEEFYGKV